jgi:hypothetical protein
MMAVHAYQVFPAGAGSSAYATLTAVPVFRAVVMMVVPPPHVSMKDRAVHSVSRTPVSQTA